MKDARRAFAPCRHVAVAAAALLLAPALRAQEVYKSIDAQGRVVYSDRGMTRDAPKTTVRVEEPDPAAAARLAKEQQALNEADAERTKRQAADDKARAAAEKKKADTCKNARTQYYRMADARRLMQRDAEGNPVYYSDEQADAMREQARKAMTAACGS